MMEGKNVSLLAVYRAFITVFHDMFICVGTTYCCRHSLISGRHLHVACSSVATRSAGSFIYSRTWYQ